MKLPRKLDNILIGTLLATSVAIYSYFAYDIYKTEKWIRAEQDKIQAIVDAKKAEKREKQIRYEAAVAERDAAIVKPEDMVCVKDFPLPTTRDYLKARKLVNSVRDKDYKEVIATLKTPLEAIVYCTEILEYRGDMEIFGKRDYHASFKYIHENKKDDCDAGGVSPAAVLSDDGFPSYVAILSTPKVDIAHEVFIYKTENGKYSSIGINDSDCLFNYNSLEELKVDICKGLSRIHKDIVIYDLKKRYPDFIDNDINNDPDKLDY